MNQNDKNYYMNIHSSNKVQVKEDDMKTAKLKQNDSDRELIVKVLEKSIENNDYTIYQQNNYKVYDFEEWKDGKSRIKERIKSGVLSNF